MMTAPVTAEQAQAAFESFYYAEGGCWLWTGRTCRLGYARFGRSHSAHRFMYWLFNGAIDDGLELDHLCRVRHCVNPDHLEPVTHQENQRRMGVAKSARITHCIRGHAFDEENTQTTATGGRKCRKCHAERCRASRMRKKGMA